MKICRRGLCSRHYVVRGRDFRSRARWNFARVYWFRFAEHFVGPGSRAKPTSKQRFRVGGVALVASYTCERLSFNSSQPYRTFFVTAP